MAAKKIYQGADRTLSPIYINQSNGRPYDLTGVTAITVCFPATDGTTVQYTLAASEVAIVGSPLLGTISVTMSSVKTALMEAGELVDFEVILDVGAPPGGDRKYVQFIQMVSVIDPAC